MPALEGTDRWVQGAHSLAGQPSQNDKLQVQFETLSPKPRWRVIEEDTQCCSHIRRAVVSNKILAVLSPWGPCHPTSKELHPHPLSSHKAGCWAAEVTQLDGIIAVAVIENRNR